jgi:hypothetical protein
MYSPFSVVRLAIFRAVGRSEHLWGISNSIPYIGAGFASISEKEMKEVRAKLPHLPTQLTPALRF